MIYIIPLVITSAKLAAVNFAKDRAKSRLKSMAKERSRQIVSDVYKRAYRGEEPDGSKFAPLAQSTVDQKTNGQILYESGRLLNATRHNVRSSSGGEINQTEIYNDVPYAAYHQYGTSNMPARKFIGLSEEDAKDYGDRLSEKIIESIFR